MDDKCRLTVVVPVYNRAKLVERSLESIRRQDVRPLRIIIVDNGSTDGSLDVVRQWKAAHDSEPGLVIDIESEPRRGAAAARRHGQDRADTEWIYFFDSDDEMCPGILSSALRVSDDCDIVFWPLEVVDLQGKRGRRRFRTGNLFRRHIFNSVLCTISYMVRRSFLREAGGWDPETGVWDDWELGVRLLLKGPRARHLTQPGAVIYSQTESLTGVDYSSKAGQWERTIDRVEASLRKYEREGRRAVGVPSYSRLHGLMDYHRIILASHYTSEKRKELGCRLRDATLERSEEPWWRKALLRLIYHYTAKGGRAAYKLWR